MIPVADCRRQYERLAGPINEVVADVLRSGRYLQGPQIQAFEAEFAAFCGVGHVVGVANGTDALEIALRALGCGPRDEIVMAANAGMYAAAATILVGATPVFADVDEADLLLSPLSVQRVLSDRVRAVVATHLYGQLCDVAALRRGLRGRDVMILEDCAQAHGARCAAGRAGSLGDLAAFSFYPTKNLGALGDGGAVATHDEELAKRTRQLAQYGWSERYHADLPAGRNSRLDELQAAVLRVKLMHLDAGNQLRSEIVARYIEATEQTQLAVVHQPHESYVAHLCVARHPRRDEVRQRLAQSGVATAIHYPVADHQQPALRGVPWRSDRLTVTERAVREIFTLPCFPEMTQEEVEHVCRCLRELD